MKKESITFSILTTINDLITGDEAIDASNIFVKVKGKEISIHMKYKGSQNKNGLIFIDKNNFNDFLKEANKLIDKYGKHIYGRGGLAENVPFDENKNSKLLKFVLSKLEK